MMPVASASGARPMGVLVTNGGVHSPGAWAKVTAASLISINPEMPEDRRRVAEALRRKIAGELFECFHEVGATSSVDDLDRLASAMHGRVLEASAGSPWEQDFRLPEIMVGMRTNILCNLNTAADLALRTE